MDAYRIQLFLPQEWALYKSIRLEALQQERGNFGNSYEMEAAYKDEKWQTSISNPLMGRFGLWREDELIGLTGIVINKDKPDEAYMTQSYIRKEHRGKGLSKLLYKARIGWAKEHNVKRLIIGHRTDNLVSKYANRRFCFKYTHSEERLWPDGMKADMLYYELYL